jgi:hypothetical protein
VEDLIERPRYVAALNAAGFAVTLDATDESAPYNADAVSVAFKRGTTCAASWEHNILDAPNMRVRTATIPWRAPSCLESGARARRNGRLPGEGV